MNIYSDFLKKIMLARAILKGRDEVALQAAGNFMDIKSGFFLIYMWSAGYPIIRQL